MPRFLILFGVAILIMLPREATAQNATDHDGPTLSEMFADLSFRYVGPSRGGRVTAVAGHRDHPRTFLMGSTGGGVWKTTDGGTHWRNTSDGVFETGSIGSIDIADSDPDIVYVGTGSDGIRSNIIIGRGLYKSTDGGETWEFKGLRETGQIGAVVVHPTNPHVVWVAALGSPFGNNPERGIYKTLDGGETWTQKLFVSEQTGGIDLELHPTDPNTIYASMWRAERKPWTIISGDDGSEDGIYVSRDGGETWEMKTEGLPSHLIGKIDFAVTPADPSRVYALVETTPDQEGLYRSNDEGETWHLVSNYRPLMDRPFYYTNVDVDPVNPDRIFVNCTGFYVSDDGGLNWERRSTPHGDNHDMWINPDDTDIWIQSNDGGANVTFDGGRTWSTQHNQPTAELYQVDLDDRDPYWLYAGQQDNTTIRVPSNATGNRVGNPESYWEAVGGCETGPAVPKPGDPDVVFSNCKGRFYQYSERTGQSRNYYVGAMNMYGRNPAELPIRFQRTVPIEVSPHDPNTVYHGSQYVHKTTDGGVTWETISPDLTAFRPERQVVSGGPITRDITGEEHYSTLYVIEESPVQAGLLWVGANDGPVHVSRDGGATWTDVTPTGMPPEGRIQHIDPSPHTAGTAYVAGYRYLLNDFEPYVYRTDDFGASWTRLTDGTNGIPVDTPVRVVREDPDREGMLFAGTEYGLYLSMDDGSSWHRFDQGLPASPITDLRIFRGDVVLSTMGRGFWIMDRIEPLRVPEVAEKNILLSPGTVTMARRYARRPGPADPSYTPAGVIIDYWLSEEASDGITLDILKDDVVVRRYHNAADGEVESMEQGMRGPFRAAARVGNLDTEQGLNRFQWDFSVDGPQRADGSIAGRLRAVPGNYTVRIAIGTWMAEQEFSLLPDPDVIEEGVSLMDLEEQYDLAMHILELMGAAADLVDRIDDLLRNAPEEVETPHTGRRDRRRRVAEAEANPVHELEEVRAQLVTDNSDSYPPPMLQSQISYLRSMVMAADQHPGNQAYDRLDVLRSEYETLLRRVNMAEETLREVGTHQE